MSPEEREQATGNVNGKIGNMSNATFQLGKHTKSTSFLMFKTYCKGFDSSELATE
jgi:hypothetical protein